MMQRTTTNRYLYFIVLILTITTCEKKVNWELEAGENNQLVVEAIFTDESMIQEVRLNRSYNDLNGTSSAITDATIFMKVNESEIAFNTDPLNAGLYKSEIPFAVIDDLNYTLIINWQGAEYIANSELSAVAPLPEISFQQIGDTNNFRLVNFASLYNPNQQAMYEVYIDWSHLSSDSITQAKMIFYTFSDFDASGLNPPPQEVVTFPKNSIAHIKKYGLNDDFAAYLKALAIETQWRGGAFYTTSASLPTNISNNGLGFFSTCAVLNKSIIVQ